MDIRRSTLLGTAIAFALYHQAAMADAELKSSLDQQVGHTHRVQNPPAALRNALVAVAA